MQLEIRKAPIGHKSGWVIWDSAADCAEVSWLWKTKKAALAEAQEILERHRESERREIEYRAKLTAERAQKDALQAAKIARREAIKLEKLRQLDLF
ncbi:hypothetical protein [Cypionkella psychrotolerans]|uniref:hypothetical protein n=1 Tax=Cypionkella psychrotolerans TaxID=1678131 RepID=UPI0006B43341|nr:hypothetical protein [Cypionkella psychrotolerans]